MPRKSVALDVTLLPTQGRGRGTYETILEKTGELLGEMGFEQLNTNLICKRAQLTPPALYRYFPNKYAVLRVLGDRLMQAQDDLVFAWIDGDGMKPRPMGDMVHDAVELQRSMIQVTRAFPGGVNILRALRAVPVLHALRVASRDAVAERLLSAMQVSLPDWPPERLRLVMRLMVELQNAAMEMVVEEGDAVLGITGEAARMFFLYFASLGAPAAQKR